MRKLFEEINKIIVEWNPLEVDPAIADDEYSGYIPTIINKLKDDDSGLIPYLEYLAQKILGTGFNSLDENHKKDVQVLYSKLKNAYDKYK